MISAETPGDVPHFRRLRLELSACALHVDRLSDGADIQADGQRNRLGHNDGNTLTRPALEARRVYLHAVLAGR